MFTIVSVVGIVLLYIAPLTTVTVVGIVLLYIALLTTVTVVEIVWLTVRIFSLRIRFTSVSVIRIAVLCVRVFHSDIQVQLHRIVTITNARYNLLLPRVGSDRYTYEAELAVPS
ncbi:hypothetical protein HanRHA438_Chr12g0560011 [Helianthus annuus]|nr:hypothetical protein HanRHA438_Chr12g0560011 [Helianthus annuus]